MNLLEDTHVKALLKGDFENRVLKSAYSRIHDYNDPLRGSVFALLMRELIRIVMDRLAPDSDVEKASWCSGEPWQYKDQSGNLKVTRRSRYRFAITGTISDEKVEEHPRLDCSAAIGELATLVSKLSKFAHLSPGTFNQSAAETTGFLGEVEDAVSQYCATLTKTKEEIRDIIWTIVDESVNDHVLGAIPDELDALSGQTLVENIHVEHLQDFDTSTLMPTLTGSGVAEIELNYGHGDDHMSSPDSYPMTFEVEVDPSTFEVSVVSVDVDTSSFYE